MSRFSEALAKELVKQSNSEEVSKIREEIISLASKAAQEMRERDLLSLTIALPGTSLGVPRIELAAAASGSRVVLYHTNELGEKFEIGDIEKISTLEQIKKVFED